MKLKIFSSSTYLPENLSHETILYPFWGKSSETSDGMWNSNFVNDSNFDSYIEQAHNIFEMSSLKDADLVVVPCNWEPIIGRPSQNSVLELLKQAEELDKLTVSFFYNDCSHGELPIANGLVFRHSLYSHTRKTHDFALPVFCDDFINKYLNKQFPIRKKQPKPIVGFSGYVVPREIKTYVKLFLYKARKPFNHKNIPPYNVGHALRFEAISKLEKSSKIQTNFSIRNKSFFHQPSLELQKLQRLDYVQNMVDSDYIFCCRGSGNYSIRFYEALSCGRIPVFLDTNCVLPYDFDIDWKKYCIWVNENEISQIADKISDFHDKISPQEFIDLQYECRQVWEKYLCAKGFYANLYRHLIAIGKL